MNAYSAAGLGAGIEKGTKMVDAYEREQTRRKEIAQQAERQNQQLAINQDINNRQNQKFQMQIEQKNEYDAAIKALTDQQKKLIQQQSKNTMQSAVNQYVKFTGTKYVGQAVNALNSVISGNDHLLGMFGTVALPNVDNPEHMNQIQGWVMKQQGDDAVPMDPETLKKVATSGQFLVDKDGNVVDNNEVIIAAGLHPQMPPDSLLKWQATMRYNNAAALASKGKFGTSGADTAFGRLAELDTIENRTPAQEIERDALTKELKITKERANNYLSGKDTEQARGEISSGDFSKLTSMERDKAMEAQLDSGVKLPAKTEEKTYGALPTIVAGQKALGEISDVSDEELRGYAQDLEKQAKTMFSDKKFNSLTSKQQQQVMSSVETNSRLGTIFSQYVQSISGAAVAEEEFARLAKNAFGGDLEKVNTSTLKTAFGTFINSLKNNISTTVENMPSTYGGYQMDLAYKLNQIPDVPKYSPSQSGTVEMGTNETLRTAAKEVAETTTSASVSTGKGIVEGIFGGEEEKTPSGRPTPKQMFGR